MCVFIPCYNEAPILGEVISDVKKIFSKSGYDFDIVVVDDFSTDNSSGVASKSGVLVVNHVMNTGVGGATATGLEYAARKGYDYAVSIDADGQHSAKDALACLKEAERTKSDLVIGSRLINSKGMSMVKIIGNKGLSIITYILFGVNVSDSQSGLRVFSRRAIEALRWKSPGYEFCSEMLWRAKQLKMSIHEYPIEAIYTEYSKSKGQNNWNGINIVKTLVKQKIVEVLE